MKQYVVYIPDDTQVTVEADLVTVATSATSFTATISFYAEGVLVAFFQEFKGFKCLN
jgi:hypothetical protein